MNLPAQPNRLSLAEEQSIYRILDASANRCREGLRVIEEYVRFHQEDEQSVKRIKTVRHQFTQVCLELDLEQALHARDTPGDVGTKISLPTEMSRQSLKDLVRANCSRVGESLRTLEEYSKLIAITAPASIEKIRYLFYDIEKHLLIDNSIHSRLEQASLYFLIDPAHHEKDFETFARSVISAGVDVIQLRAKNLSDRQLLETARQLREWTSDTRTLFIVNDRPDITLLSNADGVHVGQDELPVEEVRKIIGNEKLIGVSSHDINQAKQAVQQGANYLGVGPVFQSQTKQFEQFAGLDLIKEVTDQIEVPWFAIGGINCSNVPSVRDAGATRIAVSQAIYSADNINNTVELLKKVLLNPGTNLNSSSS